LLIRYLRGIGLKAHLRQHLSAYLPLAILCGSFVPGAAGLDRGGRTTSAPPGLFEGDPLFARFCGLKDLPKDRRFSRWLKRFAAPAVEALQRLAALRYSTMRSPSIKVT